MQVSTSSIWAQWKEEIGPWTMVAKEQRRRQLGWAWETSTAHLCLLDTESGEVIEEGRVRTLPPRPYGAGSIRSSRCA